MEVEPARIAAMLQPLAERHNADPARQEAIAQAKARGVRLAFPELSGWDLAKAWLVAASCWTAQEFKDAADLGTHSAQAALRVLEDAGWLHRTRTRQGDRFVQRFPVDDNGLLLGPAEAGAFSVMSTRTAEPPAAAREGSAEAGLLAAGGMRTPSTHVLSVTITIQVLGPESAARRRATDPDDSAQARNEAGPASAQARGPEARGRAGTPGESAPARGPEARQRAGGSPGALREEVNTEKTESSKTDRSIDRCARGGAWEIPGQGDPLTVILERETGMPFSDASVPDLVTVYRRLPPGQVFATLLKLTAERGRTNAGALNAHTEGDAAAWDHGANRDALIALGVRDHATAHALAFRVCPEVIAIGEARLRRSVRKVNHPGPWLVSCLGKSDVFEEALAAAKQQHKGRAAADAARNTQQLAANAARIDARTRREIEAQEAEARKAEELEIIRRATDRQLRDALAMVMEADKRSGLFVTNAARAIIADGLKAKTSAREIARHDRIAKYAVVALERLAGGNPATTPIPTTPTARSSRAQEAACG